MCAASTRSSATELMLYTRSVSGKGRFLRVGARGGVATFEAGMSDNSNIEWTDATWNPVRGCTKVSPGCKHCYAETFAERFRGVKGHPYEQGCDLRLAPV